MTNTGGNNQLLLGFPFGGGAQFTLSNNHEAEVYVPQGVIQNANGTMTLQAQPNPNTSAAPPYNLPYTSGAISTASFANGEPQPGGFQATYGYFQMTAELPLGAGLWPAFWLEPVNGTSAAEIDIMEAPFNNPTLIQDSLHDTVGGYTTGQVTVPNYATNYNTYGVNWNAQTITYYVNGQVVGSTPTPASANTPAYILANLAVGGQGSWPGTPTSSNTWPANMNIQSITYNPNGPGGVGSDGGTYTGGLASASPTATAAVVTPAAATAAAVTPAIAVTHTAYPHRSGGRHRTDTHNDGTSCTHARTRHYLVNGDGLSKLLPALLWACRLPQHSPRTLSSHIRNGTLTQATHSSHTGHAAPLLGAAVCFCVIHHTSTGTP